jgi:imidazolonepropionase-like amidohydrolase
MWAARAEHCFDGEAVRAEGVTVLVGVEPLAVELHDAGYQPSDALATATSVAADDCGLGGTTGRLTPGHAADLVVVDGDLSRDLEALARPVDVRVRGPRVHLG